MKNKIFKSEFVLENRLWGEEPPGESEVLLWCSECFRFFKIRCWADLFLAPSSSKSPDSEFWLLRGGAPSACWYLNKRSLIVGNLSFQQLIKSCLCFYMCELKMSRLQRNRWLVFFYFPLKYFRLFIIVSFITIIVHKNGVFYFK